MPAPPGQIGVRSRNEVREEVPEPSCNAHDARTDGLEHGGRTLRPVRDEEDQKCDPSPREELFDHFAHDSFALSPQVYVSCITLGAYR
jgi:hypothetical protein